MLGTDPQAHSFDSITCRWFSWPTVWHAQAGSVQHYGAALAVFSKVALITLAGQLPVSWKAMYTSLHWGFVTGLPQCHRCRVILKLHWCAHHYSPLLYYFLHTDLTLFWIMRVDCVRHLQFKQQIQGVRLKGATRSFSWSSASTGNRVIGFFQTLVPICVSAKFTLLLKIPV